MARSELLFSRSSLRDTLQSVTGRVVEEVDEAPEDHLLHADTEEWVAALVARRGMQTPVLGEPWMDKAEEVQVDVSHEHFMRNITRPGQTIAGYRVKVHIPFTGDGAIFLLSPSTYTLSPPMAQVGHGELIHVIEYPHDQQVNIKASTDHLVTEVEQHLGWAKGDIDQYNNELEQKARAAIENRRTRIKRHQEHLASTGLPMRAPDESPTTYIADVVVRRPAPALPQADSMPIALEPVLGDEVFNDILGIIRSVGQSIERSPKTYAQMGEEDLRQVVLTAVNPQYRGQATAEAFNFQGKTDLLIRHEGRNLFIGEFKFWSGAKGFTETIDQLFKYAAWRDTKLAIVMFVREKDLTSILEKAAQALKEHPQYVESTQAASETELRAKMNWPGDERKLADLNIFFVQLPTDAS